MTEPNDLEPFEFEHPEAALTAEAAIARAESIVAMARNRHDLGRAIATALFEAWNDGASFGATEATALSRAVIQRAVRRALAEYLQSAALCAGGVHVRS